jgi:acyl-CoA dehydrogenase
MDLALSPSELAFRDRARDFLDRALTPEIRRAQTLTTTVFAEYDLVQAWHRILHRQGWVAPSWPSEHGGTGWSIAERHIWQVESGKAGAPSVSPIGLSMVGPVVIHFGTPAQRARFLPPILSADDYWCQGFSEPGAGSDLASLRTKAVRDGDDYVVNGTKIWTTHAHFANWMIALVRTSDAGRRQEGITCLLIDMKTPGIGVRPILTIGGDHEVNQVFLDDVRAPAANRVAGEGEGWTVAKYLLEFERGVVASPRLRAGLARVVAVANGEIAGLPPVAQEPAIAARIAETAIDIDALEMLELKTSWALRTGQNPGAMASVLKLRASQLQQAVSALELEVLGEHALRWEPHRPLYDLAPGNDGADEIRPAASRFLNNRANTIFGGASEIQKGIIAKAILGL